MKMHKYLTETISYGTRNYRAELCRIKCTWPHVHPHDLELIYCLEGTLDLYSGEEHFVLQPGSLYSVNFDEIHYMYSKESALVLLFHIDLEHVSEPWSELQYRIFTCESSHCFSYQIEAMNQIKDLILALSSSAFEDLTDVDTRSAVDQIITVLSAYFDWFNYNNQDKYTNLDLRDRFYRSIQYCMHHYKEKISASDLAEIEHINPNYFSQFLANTVFNSFSYMVKYFRCFYAQHLLLSTDMPNYEIAYAVGFSDPKYFYSAFSYWWHQSPKEHRQQINAHCSLCNQENDGVVTIPRDESAIIINRQIARWHTHKCLTMNVSPLPRP